MRVGLILLLLVGCAGRPPCEVDCPDLAGTYALENTTAFGSCPFAPYELPPSMTLSQSPDRRQVSAAIIDPVSGLELSMSGRAFGPAGDTVGSFVMESQTNRRIFAGSNERVTLQLRLSGAVNQIGDRRTLSARLSTQSLDGPSAGCIIQIVTTGEGAPAT